jgi:hypothetical protein
MKYSSSTNIQDVQAFPAFPKLNSTATTTVSALQQQCARTTAATS